MDGWTHAWMDADMEAGKQVGKQQVCKQVNTRYSGTLEFKQRWADQSKGGMPGTYIQMHSWHRCLFWMDVSMCLMFLCKLNGRGRQIDINVMRRYNDG